MRTFTHNKTDEIYLIHARVWESIQRNLSLFKHCNKERWEEAVELTYVHAVTNLKPPLARSIDPYIKSLASNILKNSGPEILMDDTEEGEVAAPFLELATCIDSDLSVFDQDILSELSKVYLLYKNEFDVLLENYKEAKNTKSAYKNCSAALQTALIRLAEEYGSEEVMDNFLLFCDKFIAGAFDEYQAAGEEMKTLDLLPITEDLGSYFEKFSGVYANGGFYALKDNCSMDLVVDVEKWHLRSEYPVGSIVYKVDIYSLMDLVYGGIYVPEGVNTRFVEWFNGEKCYISPGGKRFVDISVEDFLTYCYRETITNILYGLDCEVVAVSADSVYIVGQGLTVGNLVFNLANGQSVACLVQKYMVNYSVN